MRVNPARGVYAFALAAAVMTTASAGDLPDQFRVWGSRAKAHKYLGAPVSHTARDAPVPATEAEQARGFMVFTKPPSTSIPPDFAFDARDRCTALRASDAPGQYGPITFTVFTLRRLDFSVRVTPLAGPDGGAIEADRFDIRAIRHVSMKGRVAPLLIEAFDAKTVPGQTIQQFWITYYVPEDAAPGTYRGTVRILADGREALALPLRVRVYPFRLAEPDVDMYIYSNENMPDVLRRNLIDQRCHGMNVGMIPAPVTRSGDLPREAMTRLLDICRDAGFARHGFHMHLWNRITSEWVNKPDRSIGMWGPWFRYYPFSEELDDRYVRTVRMVRDEAEKRGLKLILSVADEAGSHAWTIPATQHYNDLIKEKVPDVVRHLTVGGGWAMRKPEHDLWRGRINSWSANRWLPDELAIVRRRDPEARIELYNMGGPGSAPGGVQSARIFYGFFSWKAEADGVSQWVYHHSGTSGHNYAWPAEDPSEGKVPTLRWEAVREGAKDRRYLATLEKLLAGRTDALAEDARGFLREIAGQIELRNKDYDPIDGGRVPAHPPGTYDLWREKIAGFIERLQESR